ncbi:MAG: hypothetical protein FJ161_01290 [Gammaproteobacteria bacterium]|nr:hypothetical protein [Gammaproteobacteria bacterium]
MDKSDKTTPFTSPVKTPNAPYSALSGKNGNPARPAWGRIKKNASTRSLHAVVTEQTPNRNDDLSSSKKLKALSYPHKGELHPIGEISDATWSPEHGLSQLWSSSNTNTPLLVNKAIPIELADSDKVRPGIFLTAYTIQAPIIQNSMNFDVIENTSHKRNKRKIGEVIDANEITEKVAKVITQELSCKYNVPFDITTARLESDLSLQWPSHVDRRCLKKPILLTQNTSFKKGTRKKLKGVMGGESAYTTVVKFCKKYPQYADHVKQGNPYHSHFEWNHIIGHGQTPQTLTDIPVNLGAAHARLNSYTLFYEQVAIYIRDNWPNTVITMDADYLFFPNTNVVLKMSYQWKFENPINNRAVILSFDKYAFEWSKITPFFTQDSAQICHFITKYLNDSSNNACVTVNIERPIHSTSTSNSLVIEEYPETSIKPTQQIFFSPQKSLSAHACSKESLRTPKKR